jgi:hypothetical protein
MFEMAFNRPEYFDKGIALKYLRGTTVLTNTQLTTKTIEPAVIVFCRKLRLVISKPRIFFCRNPDSSPLSDYLS